MPRLWLLLFALVCSTALPACRKAGAGVEDTGSRQKTKEEALKVFDKHKDDYVRCEKLRIESEAQTAKQAKSGAAPPKALDYATCYSNYWKSMKQDMGPYDQAKADEWYAEWKKGVKIE